MSQMIAVWFSCGAASAVAAKLAIQKYGQDYNVRVVNNPVIEEHEDNRRFLTDVSKWIGQEIEIAINPKYPSCSAVDVWSQRNYMAGNAGAPCTLELKKKARQHWEKENNPNWHILGFTKGEEKRAETFKMGERSNFIPILIDEGMTKADCFQIIHKAGIELPSIYKMGYPNANCIGCVKATSPTYWNHVRQYHPKIFDHRAKQSRKIGAKLVRVRGKRVFLDELKQTDKGRSMKNLDFECGIFCEEKL